MTASIVRCWVATGLIAMVGMGTLRAGTVPRYDLRPGQVLTYEEDQKFKGEGEDSAYRTTWRLWVVGRNDDGSWRVVARTAMKSLKTDGSAGQESDDVTFARFDLRPDGTVPRSPTLGTRVEPSVVFPRLPGDERQVAGGWEARDEVDDATIRYRPAVKAGAGDAATFDFEADRRSFVERFYEGKDHRTFQFDRKRGLVVRSEIARGYGSHMKSEGKGTLELKSVEELEPAKIAAFREQMDRYFDAHRAYLAIYRSVETAGDDAGKQLNRARSILADARAQVTLPEPVAALEAQLNNHNRFASHQVEGAKRFARVIGHPAPAWEVKDLDGRTHTLEQYRGKVLVLDFWYRGCGWCMRAMPQVKRIAAHYRGRPVAVFGMNNDQNEDDARFVAREMPIDYPVLRSQELPSKYGVRGFPTLIIIDPQGKVADVHIGYSPHLYEEVTAAVDRLLGAK
jgi:thiol-disulfide isomerase/thioredoxin